MILKMKKENGWTYRDGVVRIETTEIKPDTINNEEVLHRIAEDTGFMDYEWISDYLTPKSKNPRTIKELFVTFKNGEGQITLTDNDVFLMSDEGKTVERIN